ncbi:hypothetical protein H8356DRAFT_1433559 [Neocallimastix lanati (nom. inval.)]|nr:hypothetical protein H8356DRAFT_1433559 [Neocallimastix sp. JGI-2020a]
MLFVYYFIDSTLQFFVISKVIYYSPLLGSNKSRTARIQTLINTVLFWCIGSFSKNGKISSENNEYIRHNSTMSTYDLSRDLSIPPIAGIYAALQIKSFAKWSKSNCIIKDLIKFIPKMPYYFWTKESRTLYKESKNIKRYWKSVSKFQGIKGQNYDSNNGEQRQLNELLFKGSSESPVPKIVGLAEFLTKVIPIISSSFELLFDRYSKVPNLTKSVDIVLIRHNDNTGSSSISTKGESLLIGSINDESGESLVDTTLSILKIFLLGHKIKPKFLKLTLKPIKKIYYTSKSDKYYLI